MKNDDENEYDNKKYDDDDNNNNNKQHLNKQHLNTQHLEVEVLKCNDKLFITKTNRLGAASKARGYETSRKLQIC